MAKIIELNDAKEDEMIPVDEWNGECWKTFFDNFCVPAAEEHHFDAWEVLADFIKKVFKNG